MANFERELITAMLEQNHFSLTKTAEQLKISRHALRYRMQRLNIAAGDRGRRRHRRLRKESSVAMNLMPFFLADVETEPNAGLVAVYWTLPSAERSWSSAP